jgi:hypothetical protein
MNKNYIIVGYSADYLGHELHNNKPKSVPVTMEMVDGIVTIKPLGDPKVYEQMFDSLFSGSDRPWALRLTMANMLNQKPLIITITAPTYMSSILRADPCKSFYKISEDGDYTSLEHYMMTIYLEE